VLINSSAETTNYLSILDNSNKNLLNIGDNNYSLIGSNFNTYKSNSGYIDLNSGNIISQNGVIIVESNIVNYIPSLFYKALFWYNKKIKNINIEEDTSQNLIILKLDNENNLFSLNNFSEFLNNSSNDFKENDIISNNIDFLLS